MYHALLTNRYLTSRIIPLIAMAAVALCVALVIIVVSVMTGFLDMVKQSGKALIGDVIISYPVTGIPYYERLIQKIEALPEAQAASPVVESWGLLRMPYPHGQSKQSETVQIWGIDPESFSRVTGYGDTLRWKTLDDEHWRWLFQDALTRAIVELLPGLTDDQKFRLLTEALRMDDLPASEQMSDARRRELAGELSIDQWQRVMEFLAEAPAELRAILTPPQWESLMAQDGRLTDAQRILDEGRALQHVTGNRIVPGIVLGNHVSEGNQRNDKGEYELVGFDGEWWMPRHQLTLTTLPIRYGSLDQKPESRIFQVVNEFSSGVFIIDDKRVMIPLADAQAMLHLDKGEIVDPDDPTIVRGEDPARAIMILVRANEEAGVTPERLKEAVRGAYEAFAAEMELDDRVIVRIPMLDVGLTVRTWEEQNASFIGPVEKERELMRTLFSIVYLVCAALVLSIFWAIVYEKTRDIGILRSIGASRGGIVWIFLRYGLVVGIIGSAAGVGLAFLVIRNINGIHSALADPPLALAIVVGCMGLGSVALTAWLARGGALLPLVVGSLASLALVGLAVGIWLLRSRGGVIIWDPAVYYFTVIPSRVDVATVVSTVIGAIIFSLLGAAIPAAKAADTDPVQALRYE